MHRCCVLLCDDACLLHGTQAFTTAVEASSNSKHQLEVAQVLSDMGVKHSVNHLTSDGLFCADILIQGYHVIIQVDEVHHWTANTAQPIGMQLGLRCALLLQHGHYGCLADT